jgi:hypothetical protein
VKHSCIGKTFKKSGIASGKDHDAQMNEEIRETVKEVKKMLKKSGSVYVRRVTSIDRFKSIERANRNTDMK